MYLQSLDEVHIDVETCEDLRSMSSPQGISSYTGPAKYSFIHKVIDGITIAVNTVLVTFKSPAFIASVQVWCCILMHCDKHIIMCQHGTSVQCITCT